MDTATVEAYDWPTAPANSPPWKMAELYYDVRGPVGAPTLVIVDNYFIICPLWRNFTAELASGFRVVTTTCAMKVPPVGLGST